jgi:hypothetical protein
MELWFGEGQQRGDGDEIGERKEQPRFGDRCSRSSVLEFGTQGSARIQGVGRQVISLVILDGDARWIGGGAGRGWQEEQGALFFCEAQYI